MENILDSSHIFIEEPIRMYIIFSFIFKFYCTDKSRSAVCGYLLVLHVMSFSSTVIELMI